MAAVWGLPVIFVIENNGYGLSTPSSEQFICKQLADRAPGYGMKGITIDGNNILEVYKAITKARLYCITEQKPILVECMTFRMRGHEEASGVKYVPKELFEEWGKKDPLMNFENYLKEQGLLDDNRIADIRAGIQKEIEDGLATGFEAPHITPDTKEEVADVYAPLTHPAAAPTTEGTDKKFIQAISEGLKQAMEHHPNLVLMGQDIAEYGGAYKLLTAGCAEAIAIILNHENNRQPPYRGYIQRFMKIALAGTAITTESQRNLFFFPEFMRKRYPVGYSQLWAQVAYHAAYMVFIGAKMKRPLPALAEACLAALPLHKQFIERHFAGCKYTQISVHGHDVFIGIQRQGSAHSNSFLPYTAEPLTDFPLPEEYQHLFLNHAGQYQFFIKPQQLII